MSLIRCFVACSLPVKVIESLRAHQQRLRDSLDSWRPGIRWTSPASFHLTLRFLGEIEEPLVAALGDSLNRAVGTLDPFEFTVQGVGGFPTLQRARVLWIGAESPALAPLAAAVEEAVQAIGLAPADKPFHPHLTLGRLQTPLNLEPALSRLPPMPGAEAPVREVVLYSSRLTPAGAVYQVLRRAPLRRAAAGSAPPANEEEI